MDNDPFSGMVSGLPAYPSHGQAQAPMPPKKCNVRALARMGIRTVLGS